MSKVLRLGPRGRPPIIREELLLDAARDPSREERHAVPLHPPHREVMRVLHRRPQACVRRLGAHPGRAAGTVVLASLALAGCAVGPRYRAPELAAPPAWSTIAQGATTMARSTPAPDLREWWKGLGDSTLSALVDEALRGAPDLQLARAKVRAARAQRVAAGADRLPSVTGSASASRSAAGNRAGGTSGATPLYDAGFDASWELDLFGRVRRAVEAAEADLEASEATAQDAQVTLVAEVASAYCDVRAAQLRLAIARRSAESQAQTLQLAEWRAQAGLVSTQDVDQARANLETTRAQGPALELSLARAEHQLDVLLGQAPGSVHARLAAPATGAALPTVPAQLAVGIPADALRRRPDIRAAERRLAAETARTGVAQGARYPTFKLSGSIGVEALSPAGLLRDGSAFSSLLAGLTAPIFDAGKLRAQAQAQDAVREQAEVQHRQAVLGALQEVEDALWALARDRDRAEALARAATSAGAAARLAEQRYAAGLIDFTSVLDAQRTALGAEDSLVSTRADGVKAVIKLYKAIGGGWPSQAPDLAHHAGEDTR